MKNIVNYNNFNRKELKQRRGVRKERKENFIFLLFYLVLNVIFLFSGCALMEKGGQLIDGSMFAQNTIAIYRSTEAGVEVSLVQNRNGEREVIIKPAKYPMIKIRASMPDEEGNFFPLSLEYLAGNLHGWNEFTLDLIGGGNFNLGENSSSISIKEIEPVEITTGRIHSYDTRIIGAEALTALRNRRERITALAEWMTSLDKPSPGVLKEFEKFWKPFLFPETVSKRKRPENYLREGDIFIRAEDIRWNTGYTQRVFPHELISVRDSATLLRDWEDALSWIYYEYEWKNIAELLSREIILTKIR